MARKVVIIVFVDKDKLLIEKRFLKEFNDHHFLIPGGNVEESINETLEQALIREALEELGVKLIDFKPLPTARQIMGLKKQLLFPFLVTKWKGNLPDRILDKGNPLIWLSIDEALKTPIKPTKKIVEAIKAYLFTTKNS